MVDQPKGSVSEIDAQTLAEVFSLYIANELQPPPESELIEGADDDILLEFDDGIPADKVYTEEDDGELTEDQIIVREARQLVEDIRSGDIKIPDLNMKDAWKETARRMREVTKSSDPEDQTPRYAHDMAAKVAGHAHHAWKISKEI